MNHAVVWDGVTQRGKSIINVSQHLFQLFQFLGQVISSFIVLFCFSIFSGEGIPPLQTCWEFC